MKRETLRNFAILGCLLVACALIVPAAMADTIAANCSGNTCTVTGTNSQGNAVNATATFAFSNNQVVITLTNNISQTDLVAINQAITGLYFTLSNGTSPSLTSSLGNLTNFNGTTTAVPAGSGSTGWKLESFSGYTHLCLICWSGNAISPPTNAIIGGTGTGVYPNANGGITQSSHSPFLYGTVSYTLSITGVNSDTTLGQVYIQFNTDNTGPTPPVPEPASMALLGTGLVGMAGAIRRKFRG